MSVTARSLDLPEAAKARIGPRIGLAAAAVAVVAGAVGLLAWWLAPETAPPMRNPFGMGLRETAPSGDLGAYLLAVQSGFYRSLQQAVSALKDQAAVWPLLAIGFAYGVFHAAGPGHGKGVIAAYVVADERALVKGFGLSLAAALVQAAVAILLVSLVAIVFRATAATMNQVTKGVELMSFAAVALLGAAITWRKAGKVLAVAALGRHPAFAPSQAASCDHVHMPPPEQLSRLTRWRDMAGVALAAGIRPCSGALVVLVFALSQGFFAAGIAATFAMALGTALTTGAIAALAVFAKALALKVAGGRGVSGAVAMAGIELLAAAFVLVLGVSLLFGLWASSAGS
jgi:nickel/cobalt exporter